MKYLILFVTLAAFTAIIYGFTIQEDDLALANKYIGFGTAALFLLAMPLFLLKHSKGKKMKDYMLTEENIKKMRKKTSEKPENQ